MEDIVDRMHRNSNTIALYYDGISNKIKSQEAFLKSLNLAMDYSCSFTMHEGEPHAEEVLEWKAKEKRLWYTKTLNGRTTLKRRLMETPIAIRERSLQNIEKFLDSLNCHLFLLASALKNETRDSNEL